MSYIKKLQKLLDINAYKSLNQYARGYRKAILNLTLISITISILAISTAFISKILIDAAIGDDPNSAIKYGILFACLLILQLSVNSFNTYYMVTLQEKMKNNLQLELLKKIYHKNWLLINDYKTGDLLTRVYNDINSIVSATTFIIPSLIAFILQLILAFSLLSYYDFTLAIIAFLSSPITIIISMIIGSKLKKIQHLIQTADGSQRSMINESLQNLIILKTYNYLTENLSHIGDLQRERYNLIKSRTVISIKANLMLGLGYRIGLFGAIALGAYRLSLKAITFGTFTAFIQLVGQIQAPIQGLSQSLPQLISSLSSVERINELEILVDDNYSPDKLNNDLVPKELIFDNVVFSYKKEVPVLEGINLNIKKGEKIAIIGPSGEGKTTLIHLLLSLIYPSSGSIHMRLENNELISVSSDTRDYFSYVPQSNTLFSGSIYDNFLLTHEVDERELEKALFASCTHEFITKLEQGLNTNINERGIGLSQGQAQRLTIARALLHNSPILVFDEATSALDLETENIVIERIKSEYPETTLIAITHRESILSICDKIFKLEKGYICEL